MDKEEFRPDELKKVDEYQEIKIEDFKVDEISNIDFELFNVPEIQKSSEPTKEDKEEKDKSSEKKLKDELSKQTSSSTISSSTAASSTSASSAVASAGATGASMFASVAVVATVGTSIITGNNILDPDPNPIPDPPVIVEPDTSEDGNGSSEEGPIEDITDFGSFIYKNASIAYDYKEVNPTKEVTFNFSSEVKEGYRVELAYNDFREPINATIGETSAKLTKLPIEANTFSVEISKDEQIVKNIDIEISSKPYQDYVNYMPVTNDWTITAANYDATLINLYAYSDVDETLYPHNETKLEVYNGNNPSEVFEVQNFTDINGVPFIGIPRIPYILDADANLFFSLNTYVYVENATGGEDQHSFGRGFTNKKLDVIKSEFDAKIENNVLILTLFNKYDYFMYPEQEQYIQITVGIGNSYYYRISKEEAMLDDTFRFTLPSEYNNTSQEKIRIYHKMPYGPKMSTIVLDSNGSHGFILRDDVQAVYTTPTSTIK